MSASRMKCSLSTVELPMQIIISDKCVRNLMSDSILSRSISNALPAFVSKDKHKLFWGRYPSLLIVRCSMSKTRCTAHTYKQTPINHLQDWGRVSSDSPNRPVLFNSPKRLSKDGHACLTECTSTLYLLRLLMTLVDLITRTPRS